MMENNLVAKQQPETTKKFLTLCMGSACHQQGVFSVLRLLTDAIEQHHLQDRLELKGAFCLGDCLEGINMEFEGQQYHHISAANIQDVFEHQILPNLEKNGEES